MYSSEGSQYVMSSIYCRKLKTLHFNLIHYRRITYSYDLVQCKLQTLHILISAVNLFLNFVLTHSYSRLQYWHCLGMQRQKRSRRFGVVSNCPHVSFKPLILILFSSSYFVFAFKLYSCLICCDRFYFPLFLSFHVLTISQRRSSHFQFEKS